MFASQVLELRELAAEPLDVVQADLVLLYLVFVDLGGVLHAVVAILALRVLYRLGLLQQLASADQVLVDLGLVLQMTSLLVQGDSADGVSRVKLGRISVLLDLADDVGAVHATEHIRGDFGHRGIGDLLQILQELQELDFDVFLYVVFLLLELLQDRPVQVNGDGRQYRLQLEEVLLLHTL